MKQWSIIRALKDFRSLLFMDLCIACYSREPIPGKLFCLSCYAEIPYIKSQDSIPALLIGKDDLPPEVEAFNSLFTYNKADIIKKMIDNLKYRGRGDIGVKLGKQLGKLISETRDHEKRTLIPVPLHPKRLRERGYNQALKISQGITEELDSSINESILLRIKYNESQTKKSAQERKGVKEQKFALSKSYKLDPDRHAIIVDDIITTGSTISACYNLLKEAGYKRISVATLAITI